MWRWAGQPTHTEERRFEDFIPGLGFVDRLIRTHRRRVKLPASTNPMYLFIGIGTLPYGACHPSCVNCVVDETERLNAMPAHERSWLLEFVNLPASWELSRGIVEIRNEHVRIQMNGPSVRDKYVVSLE